MVSRPRHILHLSLSLSICVFSEGKLFQGPRLLLVSTEPPSEPSQRREIPNLAIGERRDRDVIARNHHRRSRALRTAL